jgi:hypothetical protein
MSFADFPCARCSDPDAVVAEGDVCRDCRIAESFARGSCRECLRWIMREEYGGPRAMQHVAGCSLAESLEYAPRDEAEMFDVLRRNGDL